MEIGKLFVFAGLLALLFRSLRQPLIPAFVLAGVLVGPLGLNYIHHLETISEIAEISTVVMLFVIGIEMDLSRLRVVGFAAVIGGLLQVAATFAVGFGAAKLFGVSGTAAAYFGFASAFSSTMVVIKVLGEKRDLNTLYGRITVGILVIQDICAVFALSVLSIKDFSATSVVTTLTLAAGLILIVVFICGKFIFPRLLDYVAHDKETLFTIVMGILFLGALYANQQGLSLGIGSFLAGLALARLAYKYEISGELKALKSFFAILFFVSLGLGLSPTANLDAIDHTRHAFYQTIAEYGWMIVVFTLIMILVKPLITMVIMGMFGYERRESFSIGVSIGQLSEFGLVLFAQGIAVGALARNSMPPMIIVAVLSIVFSSYVMKFNEPIFQRVKNLFGWLNMIRVSKPHDALSQQPLENNFEFLLVGRDKLGKQIEKALRKKTGVRYLVVDSDPDVIATLRREKVPYLFGDITNPDVLDQINFKTIRTVCSTVPDIRDNEALMKHVQEINPETNFIGIVESGHEAEELYQRGAHYVLVPYFLAGQYLLHTTADDDNVNLEVLTKENTDIRVRGARHRERLRQGIERADATVA
ncbi:MAG: cation:proton antiporter [Candidatus Pacebacteria bacterium]|nr:cation:proton antiporter [Candidatus Paceibacterota bacterium]